MRKLNPVHNAIAALLHIFSFRLFITLQKENSLSLINIPRSDRFFFQVIAPPVSYQPLPELHLFHLQILNPLLKQIPLLI